MIEISLNKVTKNYGFSNILKDISFDIKEKERVCLIGSNGCGKSTILKIICNEEPITSGEIALRVGSKIGFLSQIIESYPNTKVKEYINRYIKDIILLKEKMTKYEEDMSVLTGKKLEKAIDNYLKIQEAFNNLNGYEIDAKISKTLNAFKIDNNLLERDFASLSGGEKTIISLASLIIGNFDILLLDEPTNHLDIKAMEFLEEVLINFKGTVLFVSHDRYFIDKVSTKTILIEREDVQIFFGNYSYFLKENEARVMKEFKDFSNQVKQIEKMKETIHKLREWGKIGDNERFFKRAICIERRLEKMERLNPPIQKKDIPINFEIDSRSGNDVLEVNNLNISFDDKIIFKNASLEIKNQEKVCLIGINGSGKSTFIKCILNNINEIKIGSNVKIGYIPQYITFEDESIRLIDEAKKYFHLEEQYLRSALCKFFFNGDNIFKKLNSLSGGERVRLKLFSLMQLKTNFLILDEPTNHIDIDTREVLENALNDFNGTILFVSHDRYFINNLATRIISIENHTFKSYLGNYDYYNSKKSS